MCSIAHEDGIKKHPYFLHKRKSMDTDDQFSYLTSKISIKKVQWLPLNVTPTTSLADGCLQHLRLHPEVNLESECQQF